ncbi:hypothetical protein HWV62_15124 [Athelia sp. TMB]|nr:hypothetical protein HWV62_15124 [Athelia sp. TMB]
MMAAILQPRPPAMTNNNPLAAWDAVVSPVDETPEQRRAREEARRTSARIDEELKAAHRAAAKKRKEQVKVLVLGQSESDFQLAYAYQAWADDLLSWRPVIFLNLVRSINKILHIVANEMDVGDQVCIVLTRIYPAAHTVTQLPTPTHSQPPSPLTSHVSSSSRISLSELAEASRRRKASSGSGVLAGRDDLKLLSMRLSPLVHVQRDLEVQVGAGSTEVVLAPTAPAADADATPFLRARANPEFAVRTSWIDALARLRTRASLGGERRVSERRLAEAMGILAGCAADMEALWGDAGVRAVLARRGVRMEDEGGFFLDDIARLASPRYEPTDKDVLRARLRTVGVQEYAFTMERGQNDVLRAADRQGQEVGRQWIMYDVGGARTTREKWYPYFDDIHAIIFLAPLSCFDEVLAEDPRVNRVRDSLLLWAGICASELLKDVQFVLFLNKCDILSRKLKERTADGARAHRVKDYFPAFGDAKQETKAVGECACLLRFLDSAILTIVVSTVFRREFKAVMKMSKFPDKTIYAHMVTVTEHKSTAATLRTVRDGIVRDHLERALII